MGKYPSYKFQTVSAESSHGIPLVPAEKVDAVNKIVADANQKIDIIRAMQASGQFSEQKADEQVRRVRIQAYLELGKLGLNTRTKLAITREYIH
ncbi:MAG: hypothetical protein E6L02_07600 [Thaumarchaeota archaeon]|nr:MAG: hypothetical protein E6L02_07600 [Nitrososphaerota archaeon]